MARFNNLLKMYYLPSLVFVPVLWIFWQSASGVEGLAILFFAISYGLFIGGGFLMYELFWTFRMRVKRVEQLEIDFEQCQLRRRFPQITTIRYVSVFSLMLVFSIAGTSWPLRLAVAIWRQPLERLYVRVERDETIQTPLRIGTFLVRRAEIVEGGYPALILGGDPTGYTSLVRAKEEPGNKWSCIHLQDNWMLFSED